MRDFSESGYRDYYSYDLVYLETALDYECCRILEEIRYFTRGRRRRNSTIAFNSGLDY